VTAASGADSPDKIPFSARTKQHIRLKNYFSFPKKTTTTQIGGRICAYRFPLLFKTFKELFNTV
jgi:hypothetical protein